MALECTVKPTVFEVLVNVIYFIFSLAILFGFIDVNNLLAGSIFMVWATFMYSNYKKRKAIKSN